MRSIYSRSTKVKWWIILIALLTLAAVVPCAAQNYKISGGLVLDEYINNTAVSPDGRYVAYSYSYPEYAKPWCMILYDRQTQTSKQIDLSPSGALPDARRCDHPTFSGDSRYIAYESGAGNLVDGDTNAKVDIFVYDNQLGKNVRVSLSTSGVQPNNDCTMPEISNDGKFVVYQSRATNLVSGDTNDKTDVFIRDIANNTTERVSVDAAGQEKAGYSEYPSVSADGSLVAFQSSADELVPGGVGKTSIYVKNRASGQIRRVSVSTSGSVADNNCNYPKISANGRYVVWISRATNLVPNDTNAKSDVFRHDLQTGETILVSVNSTEAQSNGDASTAYISSDGRYVAFTSNASNLGGTDTNNIEDLYIRDIQAGVTVPVSVSYDPAKGNVGAFYSGNALSTDGMYAVFLSNNQYVVDNNVETRYNVYLRDMKSDLGSETLTIGLLAPDRALNTGVVSMTISGTGFNAAATVKMTKAGQSDIAATNTVVAGDGKTITTKFDITGKSIGTWKVVVTNPGPVSVSSDFIIQQGVSVTKVTPSSALFFGTHTLKIDGSGFVTGATAKLSRTGVVDTTSTSATVAGDGKSLQADFDLSSCEPGVYDVVVVNSDGASGKLSSAFTVIDGIAVSSVSPSTGVSGKYAILTINGRGFVPETTVKLKAQGQPDIVATDINAASNGKTLTAKVALDAAELGKRDVVVTGKPGFDTTLPGAFSIQASVSSISPSSMNAAASTVDVTFKGSGFAADMAVKLTRSGSPDWVASSVKYNSNSEIVVTFTESGTEPMGKWTVMMGRPDYLPVDSVNEVGLKTSVDKVNPDHIKLGQTTRISIAMTGAASGITAKLQSAGKTDIVGKNIVYVSGGMTVEFAVPEDVNAVSWNLLLTCPNGRIIESPVKIQTGAGVWSVYPSLLGQAPATVKITASGYSKSLTAKLTRSGMADIPGKIVAFNKASSENTNDSALCTFDLTNAELGKYDLVVADGIISASRSGAIEVGRTRVGVSVYTLGSHLIRTGRTADIEIRIENTGNVDVAGNLSILGASKNLQWVMRDDYENVMSNALISANGDTNEIVVSGLKTWAGSVRSYHFMITSSVEDDMEFSVAWVGLRDN